jgi:glutamate dehydrogenase
MPRQSIPAEEVRMDSPTDPRQSDGPPRNDLQHTLIAQALRDEGGADRPPAFIEQLTSEIDRRQPPGQAAPMAEFARQFYDKFPLKELQGRALSDLYASASGGWHFLQNYDASRPKVQIFNPEFDRHGWQLPHTVVALLCRDMPFALDSVRGELNSRNITIITIHSVSLRVQRDEQHHLLRLLSHNGDGAAAAAIATEAFIYLEINRHSNPEDIAQLQQAIIEVLAEVECVVDDFTPMRARAAEVRRQLPAGAGNGNGSAAKRAAVEEVGRFIDWLLDDNFTFLGYEYLQVDHAGAQPRIERAADAYGLLRGASSASERDLRA